MEKLRAPATAFWTIVYGDLDQTRGSLLCFNPKRPTWFEHIHDKVTRFGELPKVMVSSALSSSTIPQGTYFSLHPLS